MPDGTVIYVNYVAPTSGSDGSIAYLGLSKSNAKAGGKAGGEARELGVVIYLN